MPCWRREEDERHPFGPCPFGEDETGLDPEFRLHFYRTRPSEAVLKCREAPPPSRAGLQWPGHCAFGPWLRVRKATSTGSEHRPLRSRQIDRYDPTRIPRMIEEQWSHHNTNIQKLMRQASWPDVHGVDGFFSPPVHTDYRHEHRPVPCFSLSSGLMCPTGGAVDDLRIVLRARHAKRAGRMRGHRARHPLWAGSIPLCDSSHPTRQWSATTTNTSAYSPFAPETSRLFLFVTSM